MDGFFHRKGRVPGLAGRLKDGSLHQFLGFGLQIGPKLPAQRVQHAQPAQGRRRSGQQTERQRHNGCGPQPKGRAGGAFLPLQPIHRITDAPGKALRHLSK